MKKIMIHTCNRREWYVYDYLIPSLLQQGILGEEIIVWHDYDRIGNLQSFIASMQWVGENLNQNQFLWHLQDDVLISSKFKEAIDKEYQEGIVCGFCYAKFGTRCMQCIGRVPASNMWFSFPCIRIPNSYARSFAEWIRDPALLKNERFFKWWKTGKMDDSFFYEWVMRNRLREYVMNLKPNIVQHIDWLIGGTLVNQARPDKYVRSAYWEQENLVKDLEEKLLGVLKS